MLKVNQTAAYLVSVAQFNGEADKNGKAPVYLNVVSGNAVPQKARVLSGTVAENLGLTPGTVALVSVSRIADSEEYGEQYRHSLIQKSNSLADTMSVMGLAQAATASVSAPAVQEEVPFTGAE